MSIERRIYTTQEIADIIGHSIHKTISYIKRGYIKPSIQDAQGHGTKRLWSYLDVVRMSIIRYLEDLGVRVARLREVCDGMTDERLAKNQLWGLTKEGDVTALEMTMEGAPHQFIRASGEELMEVLEFESNPAQILVVLRFFHAEAQKRITAMGLE